MLFSNRYGTILSNIIIQIILQFIDLIHTSRVVRKKLGFKLHRLADFGDTINNVVGEKSVGINALACFKMSLVNDK